MVFPISELQKFIVKRDGYNSVHVSGGQILTFGNCPVPCCNIGDHRVTVYLKNGIVAR